MEHGPPGQPHQDAARRQGHVNQAQSLVKTGQPVPVEDRECQRNGELGHRLPDLLKKLVGGPHSKTGAIPCVAFEVGMAEQVLESKVDVQSWDEKVDQGDSAGIRND